MANACLSQIIDTLMSYTVCDVNFESCMMGCCKECPGKEALVEFLSSVGDIPDEIEYMQWISTDRTTLVHTKQNTNEYIETLAGQVSKLTRHSFEQNNYVKYLKATISTSELLTQGDFSENYSFIIQDEIQISSYHWDYQQAALHPLVVYSRNVKDEVLPHSVCVISDTKDHTTSTVWSFQKQLLQYLREKYAAITKIHYFTDGCVGQ